MAFTRLSTKEWVNSKLKHKSCRTEDRPRLLDCLMVLNVGNQLDQTQQAFIDGLRAEEAARAKKYRQRAAEKKKQQTKETKAAELNKQYEQANKQEVNEQLSLDLSEQLSLDLEQTIKNNFSEVPAITEEQLLQELHPQQWGIYRKNTTERLEAYVFSNKAKAVLKSIELMKAFYGPSSLEVKLISKHVSDLNSMQKGDE